MTVRRLPESYHGTGRVPLSGKSYMALRMTRID
ncbi:DUF5605 domain-containing protein [Paenibacillus sp. P26]|nr:DUF5605 domain-containing protein [Paenibacillus sp. P26]